MKARHVAEDRVATCQRACCVFCWLAAICPTWHGRAPGSGFMGLGFIGFRGIGSGIHFPRAAVDSASPAFQSQTTCYIRTKVGTELSYSCLLPSLLPTVPRLLSQLLAKIVVHAFELWEFQDLLNKLGRAVKPAEKRLGRSLCFEQGLSLCNH